MEDFQEALPTDTASGFSSPAASGGKEGYGGAFILGHSEAAHEQAKAIRSQLASMAATRIKQQEGLLRMGDVPIKGALTEHIYNFILPAKKKLHEKLSKISQRQADNSDYLGSKEGREELLAAEQDKLALQASIQASVNANSTLSKFDALYSASPSKYKSSYVKDAANVRQTSPELTSGLLAGLLQDRPDYLKFVKEASGNVGKLTTESIVGDKTVTNENLGAKFNERLERSVDASLSTQEGKDNIENIAELDKISYADAEKKVRQNIKDAIDTKYAEKMMSEGFAEEQSLIGDVNNNINIQTGRGTNATTAFKKIQARTKKPVPIATTSTDVYDLDSRSHADGLPTVVNVTPSDVVDINIKKKEGGLVRSRMIVGNIAYYDEAESKKIKDGMWNKRKDEYFAEHPNASEADANKATEPSASDVEQEMARQGKQVKTRDLLLPYEVNKNIFGRNAAAIDKRMGKLEQSQQQKQAVKLTGKVNPSSLKVGETYNVSGVDYVWNGSKLKKK